MATRADQKPDILHVSSASALLISRTSVRHPPYSCPRSRCANTSRHRFQDHGTSHRHRHWPMWRTIPTGEKADYASHLSLRRHDTRSTFRSHFSALICQGVCLSSVLISTSHTSRLFHLLQSRTQKRRKKVHDYDHPTEHCYATARKRSMADTQYHTCVREGSR